MKKMHILFGIGALALATGLTACGEDSSSSGCVEETSSSSVKDGSEYDAITRTLTDLRDGQVYKTVTIGTQTWMAENLNYNYNSGTAKSFCYGDFYGRLYFWSAAMDSAAVFSTAGEGCGYGRECNTSGVVRGVCPEGWHLPSYEEWETLLTAVGGKDIAGKMLKSTSGWNYGGDGTDAYGFSALPAGGRYSRGVFRDAGSNAYFWSATQREDNSYYAYFMYLYYYDGYAYLFDNYKDNGRSVRCLQNPN